MIGHTMIGKSAIGKSATGRSATGRTAAAAALALAMATTPARPAEPARDSVGTLACQLKDAIAAYASFGSQNPLLCDFRPAGAVVVSRLPMRILAQVEGAPTARGQFAVWRVVAPAGTDAAKLAGEYGASDDEGALASGEVALVPAEDPGEVAAAMASMEPPSEGARNVAAWISDLRL
jgi:hypothetical protein